MNRMKRLVPIALCLFLAPVAPSLAAGPVVTAVKCGRARVPGDPLADITELDEVGFVMKGGVVARDEMTKR